MARPIEYDREIAVRDMRRVFWRQGYGATSVNDLVNATRLKPGSLYGAFESKQGAMLAVLENYSRDALARNRAVLLGEGSPRANMEQFFHDLVERTVCDDECKGCLLVNALLETAGLDEVIAGRTREALSEMENLLRENLERARNAGELKSPRPPAGLAVFLIGIAWSVRVLARTGPPRERLEALIEPALDSVFL